MKQTDLMLNDLAAVRVFSQIPTYEVRRVDLDLLSRFDKLQVEPIELTPEIMEANGFERLHDINGRPIAQFKLHCDNPNTEDFRFCFYDYHATGRVFRVSDNSTEIFVVVAYVHELQQFLRLIGLNDLANNLKLTKGE